MSKLINSIKRHRLWVITLLFYNYFWFLVPYKWIVNNTFVKNWDFLEVVFGVPVIFLVFYHYFFNYYLVIVYSIFLIYRVIRKPEKRTQYVIVLCLNVTYIFLWFMVVSKHFADFPIPRIT